MSGILEQLIDEIVALRADIAAGVDVRGINVTPTETMIESTSPSAVTPEMTAPGGPTLDDVRGAMCAMVAEKGEAAADTLLSEFGASCLSEVDPARWAGLMEKASRFPTLDVDAVRKVCAAIMEKDGGHERLKALLEQFNAVSISSLKPEYFAPIHEEALKILEAS